MYMYIHCQVAFIILKDFELISTKNQTNFLSLENRTKKLWTVAFQKYLQFLLHFLIHIDGCPYAL